MLSIVETLKEYRNILLGQDINVYTDHKNHTNPKTITASPRIQRWRWTIEEFNPTLIYIQGEKNKVADCISRLEFDHSTYSNNKNELNEIFNAENLINTNELFPLDTFTIAKHQQKDVALQTYLNNDTKYFTKKVHGAEVVLFNNKMYIPKSLRNQILDWYHVTLQHPGATRTEKTIR